MHCPVTGINIPRFLLAAFFAFAFIFGFEFVYHGILLKPQYMATMDLWRPKADMIAYFPYAVAVQLGAAVLIVALFALTGHTGLKYGLKFGVVLGLLLGILQLGMYPYLPVPIELAGAWFAGAFLETIVVGLIAGLFYRP